LPSSNGPAPQGPPSPCRPRPRPVRPPTPALRALPAESADAAAAATADTPAIEEGPLGPLAPGQTLIHSTCQAETYAALAARAAALAEAAGPAGRVLIALAGGPGSGKTTAAAGVAARLAALVRPGPGAPRSGAAPAVVLPMDGFHYTRSQLDAFPDPAAAHARRGAPWTFDVASFAAAVAAAAVPGASLDAPSFDHGAGDPLEGGVAVRPWHRVVLVEGNYVLCPDGGWEAVGDAAAERWFLGCPLEAAMARVAARQRRQGRAAEVVAARIAENDRPNAILVNACIGRADVVARSDLPAGNGGGGGGGRGGKKGGGARER